MPCGIYERTPEHRARQRAVATGKHPSAETRAKMSIAQKKRSPETRTTQRAAMIGNKYAEGNRQMPDWCAKHSAAMMDNQYGVGYRHTPEAVEKIRTANVGPNNPQWRGGISREPYGWEWNDELREEVRRRDGYRCRVCGVPQDECNERLNVHHANYLKQDNDPLNLVSLCRSCHSRTVKRRKYWIAIFQTMVLNRDLAALRSRRGAA